MRLAIFVLCLVIGVAGAKPRASHDRSFIYMRGSSDVLMSGNSDDLERVRKAIKPRERVLWARTADGSEYLIRDTAVLDELDRAWKRANEFAAALGKLGDEQGKLGDQLGKIGEQQGKLGERMGQLGEQLAEAPDGRRPAIEREMKKLEAQMREVEAQMKQFEQPMRALDRKMREIEPKHDEAAKQAEAATDALIARAIASGAAKPF